MLNYSNGLSEKEIRIISMMSYIGPLFVVGRVLNKGGRSYSLDFHSWQGGILFFTMTAAYNLVGYIAKGGILFPVLREVVGLILYFGVSVGGIILSIMGVLNAYKGEQIYLPLVGDIDKILRKHYNHR